MMSCDMGTDDVHRHTKCVHLTSISFWRSMIKQEERTPLHRNEVMLNEKDCYLIILNELKRKSCICDNVTSTKVQESRFALL